jgi:hypothetical protein
MKYYVVKLLTNTQGQDASSVTVYPSEKDARVAYHNTLAAFHNAEDVLYAIVQIVNEYGNCVIMEIVDHKPTPEPEPIPIEEQTEE